MGKERSLFLQGAACALVLEVTMASLCSALYASWLPLYHGLMAAITEEQLEIRRGGAEDLKAVRDHGVAVLEWYDSQGEKAAEDLPDLRALIQDGLHLSLQFRELIDALGRTEGDPIFALYDDIADHAETLAESFDPQLEERIRQAENGAWGDHFPR
ncbi:MAG: hypothetical protein IT167_19965 [Bryobacterales bacterium]|nr:hypothetical protein [Bryobacterales bacterium]